MEQINEVHQKNALEHEFSSGGARFKPGTLCIYTSVVLVKSFVLRNRINSKAKALPQPTYRKS